MADKPGIDVNASRTISGLGAASAGTARQLELLGTKTLKYTAIAGGMGVAVDALAVGAVGAAGAIGVVLGGAILGLGVKAALMNTQLKATFKDLGDSIKKEINGVTGPTVKALTGVAASLKTAFAQVQPQLAGIFRQMAPIFTNLGQGAAGAIHAAANAAGPMLQTLTPILRVLSGSLAPTITAVAQALQNILKPLAANSAGFQAFIGMIDTLLPQVGALIGNLVQLGTQVLPLIAPLFTVLVGAVNSIIGPFARLGAQILPTLVATLTPLLHQLAGGLAQILPVVGKAINAMLPPLGKLIGAFLQAAKQILPVLLPVLARVVATLANAAAQVLPALVPILTTLIQAIGNLLPVLTPLIPPLLVLLTSVSNLIPPLVELAGQLIAALLPAIQAVLPALVSLSGTLGKALADAITAAAPGLTALATALGAAVIALTPLLPAFGDLATSVLPPLGKIVGGIAGGFGKVVDVLAKAGPLLPILAVGITAVVVGMKAWALATKAWAIAMAVAEVVASPLILVIGGIALAVAGIGVAIYVLAKHWNTVWRAVVSFFGNYVAAPLLVAFKAVGDGVLSMVIGILQAASHLPFVGGKFAGLANDVRGFKNSFDSSMESAITSAHNAGREIPAGLNPIAVAASQAAAHVRILAQTLQALPGHKSVVVTYTTQYVQVGRLGTAPQARSRGGWVTGGIPGLDSVPSLLMPGEYVESVAEARRIRGGTGRGTGGGVVNNYYITVTGVISDEDATLRRIAQGMDRLSRNGHAVR